MRVASSGKAKGWRVIQTLRPFRNVIGLRPGRGRPARSAGPLGSNNVFANGASAIVPFFDGTGSARSGFPVPPRFLAQPETKPLFARLSAYAPQALAMLRIVTALLFMLHGTQKLLGFPASDMAPPLFSLFGLAGIIEIVAGLLVLVGFFTRPAAFI